MSISLLESPCSNADLEEIDMHPPPPLKRIVFFKKGTAYGSNGKGGGRNGIEEERIANKDDFKSKKAAPSKKKTFNDLAVGKDDDGESNLKEKIEGGITKWKDFEMETLISICGEMEEGFATQVANT